jgi:proteasome lid subunit RPN8/RPN11
MGGSTRSLSLNGLVLPYRERRRLHDRASRAQRRNQAEVCGVVLVSKTNRLYLRFLRNQSRRPGEFRIDREDARAAVRAAEKNGHKLLGTFHSHPISEALPSPGDLDCGFLDGHELIYDVCGRDARLWRLKSGATTRDAEEVSLRLEPRPRAPRRPARAR